MGSFSDWRAEAVQWTTKRHARELNWKSHGGRDIHPRGGHVLVGRMRPGVRRAESRRRAAPDKTVRTRNSLEQVTKRNCNVTLSGRRQPCGHVLRQRHYDAGMESRSSVGFEGQGDRRHPKLDRLGQRTSITGHGGTHPLVTTRRRALRTQTWARQVREAHQRAIVLHGLWTGRPATPADPGPGEW